MTDYESTLRRYSAAFVFIASACTLSLALPAAVSGLSATSPGPAPEEAPARGPLRVHPDNPRYFTDGSGRAVYLTGSHTWNNLVDMGRNVPPERVRSFLS